ncbi:MAG TPA: ABC transporter ATP-binding protein [Pseudonocardiaceae bacterium]|nr:ABC transporter ATP-binding protein [Pseudonocardiaceae bacterium]
MPALLECSGLSWTVGGTHILDDIGFAVRAGEFVAVIGPNGAGKTSLLNVLSGLVRPTSGRITLSGEDITAEPPHRRARRGVARTFQSSSVFPTMTVGQHVRLARRVGRTGAEPAEVLHRVGLDHLAGAVAGRLSHGDRRKLEIALVLAGAADRDGRRLLLLDEPMAGMSADEVPGLTDVLRDVHTGGGHAVLMVEHHMEVLMSLADRVVVLHHGALLAVGTPAEVTADPVVQEAYLGQAP